MQSESQKQLKEHIAALEAENAALRERIDYLEGIPSLRAGIRGEILISQLVGGRMTAHSAPHDVVVEHAGLKLEVKFSRLGIPMKSSRSRRWSWNHPLGLYDGKDFNRLILIGEADPRFRDRYRDTSSPYVIFDLPHERAKAIMRKDKMIQVTTNPKGAWGDTARLLFGSFQSSLDELKQRYGISDERPMASPDERRQGGA